MSKVLTSRGFECEPRSLPVHAAVSRFAFDAQCFAAIDLHRITEEVLGDGHIEIALVLPALRFLRQRVHVQTVGKA